LTRHRNAHIHNSLTNGKTHVYLNKQIPVDIQ